MGSKITMIKGSSTPEVFCAQLLEMADKVEHIACVVQFKKEYSSTEVFSTTMSSDSMTWLRWVFDQDFRPERSNDKDCN